MKLIGFTLVVVVALATIVLAALATQALAAGAPEGEDYGLLAGTFLGFASVIVAAKLIPGIIRFASIIGEEKEDAEGGALPAAAKNSP